jgi:carboxyl-terminal processing protease
VGEQDRTRDVLLFVTVVVLVCQITNLFAVGGVGWLVANRSTDTAALPVGSSNKTLDRHLRIFTQLWEIVYGNYLYPDYNGADWDAIGEEYRARVEEGLTDEEFWLLMDEMLLELDDDHSIFLSPAQADAEDEAQAGELDYVGVGIATATLPEKEYIVILSVLPDSPAERAGLQAHDRLLEIDGTPACCDEEGYDSSYLLYGDEGNSVDIQVQTPGDSPRTVTVKRAHIQSAVPVQVQRLEGDIGYILIPTFWDETTYERVHRALQQLASEGKLSGLIIDLRINAGGYYVVLRGLLALFADGELGSFVGRTWEQPMRVLGIDVGGSQSVPLAILVGTETASYAEVFSGVLQETGRAQIVGRTTLGNVETMYSYDFEDGSRAWIAEEMFRPPSGADWEKEGIVPDIEIPLDWDEFTADDDAQLEAAIELLQE